MTRHPQASRRRGFTLVEVMVALGIVAVALLAGLRATGTLTANAGRQADLVLAQLCAENALVRARLSRQLPGVGDTQAACEQGGRAFSLVLSVRPTPNPDFRRIDAQVRNDADASVLTLSSLIGRS